MNASDEEVAAQQEVGEAKPAPSGPLSQPISRRTALRRLRIIVGGAAALVAAEACGGVLLGLYGPHGNIFGGPINLGPKGSFPAATPQGCVLDKAGVFYRTDARCFIVHLSAETAFLLSGDALVDTLASESILRDADGSYWLALYQACVHLGTTVKFKACGVFNCPSHGATYSADGEYLDGPAPRSLDRFPLSFDDGDVVVDTGRLNSSVDRPAAGARLLPVPDLYACFAQ